MILSRIKPILSAPGSQRIVQLAFPNRNDSTLENHTSQNQNLQDHHHITDWKYQTHAISPRLKRFKIIQNKRLLFRVTESESFYIRVNSESIWFRVTVFLQPNHSSTETQISQSFNTTVIESKPLYITESQNQNYATSENYWISFYITKQQNEYNSVLAEVENTCTSFVLHYYSLFLLTFLFSPSKYSL